MLKCTAQIETASISQHQQTSWCKERKIENHLQGCQRCEASRRSGSLMALYNRGGQARRSIYIWAYNISTRRTLTKGVHGGRGKEREGRGGVHVMKSGERQNVCATKGGRQKEQDKPRAGRTERGPDIWSFFFHNWDVMTLQGCQRAGGTTQQKYTENSHIAHFHKMSRK